MTKPGYHEPACSLDYAVYFDWLSEPNNKTYQWGQRKIQRDVTTDKSLESIEEPHQSLFQELLLLRFAPIIAAAIVVVLTANEMLHQGA